jgi:tetratricopeptide (TPR) repeat protein
VSGVKNLPRNIPFNWESFTMRHVLLAVATFVTTALPSTAQHKGPGHLHGQSDSLAGVRLLTTLGSYEFKVTSKSERATRYFNQGLRLYWAFNHPGAVESFREAERLDPACAMCAWGTALALGPNVNAPMAPAAWAPALDAVRRAQAASALVSPEEQALIAALAERYAEKGERAVLDSAYADAMERVAARYPDDAEVLSLFAESLMNLSPWNYWHRDGAPRPDTPVLMERLRHAMDTDPNHPGACHLFIHAVEARDPASAVPCAEKLASMMPGAGHLVHMPAHIYVRVGRYADAVAANVHAVHADEAYLEGSAGRGRGIYGGGYYPHNWHFLAFAASMSGSSAIAIDAARKTVQGLDHQLALETPWLEAVTPVLYQTLVTFGKWDTVLVEPLPAPEERFATGFAYYARGVAFAAKRRFAEARAALDSVSAIQAGLPDGDNQTALAIAEFALAGEMALRQGRASEAVRQFRAATALEDGLVYAEPPTWYYPMRHSLGKALLAANRPVEAEKVYRQDLGRFPNNGWSLFGLAESLRRQGKVVDARKARKLFDEAWRQSDVRLTASRFLTAISDCGFQISDSRGGCGSKPQFPRHSPLKFEIWNLESEIAVSFQLEVQLLTDCRSSHVMPVYSLMLRTAVTGLLVIDCPLQAPPGETERTTMRSRPSGVFHISSMTMSCPVMILTPVVAKKRCWPVKSIAGAGESPVTVW